MACLYEADVSFLNIEEGVVINRLRREDGPGAEEEIVSLHIPFFVFRLVMWRATFQFVGQAMLPGQL